MNHKKWTRRTSEQKAAMVQEIKQLVNAGASAESASRTLGIAASQYHRWSKELAGKPNGAARMVKPRNANTEKQLLIENQRLKMIVAEQALDIQALKEWGSR